MNKVFISTTSFGIVNEPFEVLRKYGISYTLNPYKRKLTEHEIKDFLQDGYVGLIAGTEPITKEVLNFASKLKVISRVGAGIDNIDLEASKKLGIKIYNTPTPVVDAVAELTIGLIFNALRKITLNDKNIRQGIWKKLMGNLLRNKNIGIIGFGRIGKKVAEILAVLGANVFFYDNIEISSSFTQVDLDHLLRESDIICLHASGKEEILTKEKIELVKEVGIIINTARGELINEQALFEGLKNGKIAWACLDVFKNEPYNGLLKELENVTLTPHIGSYAKEARAEMEKQAVLNLLEGLEIIK